ncbi:hypothetical protein HY636_06050 [Candidatus Woesearchaeota archaeon]|nr:hypothetical protein [Candidatus Woesearchaeota archaeon]
MGKDAVIVASSKKTMKKIDNTDLTKLNKQELVKLYQEMQTAYHGILDVSHIIEGISFVVEPLLKKKIEEALKLERHDPEFRKLFNLLMQPAKPSFANEEYIDILEIVKLVKKDEKLLCLFNDSSPQIIFAKLNKTNKKIKEKITAHRKRFLYNQINYYHGNPLSELDYISEIKKLIEENKEESDIDDKLKAEKERYGLNAVAREKIIREHKFNDEINSLIHISMEVLHWQDNRKKNILTGVYYMNIMLNEISKRYSIPLEKIKRYLPEEITEDKLDNFSMEDANERMKHYIVYSRREDGKLIFEIYTKEDYEEIMNVYNKTYTEQNDIHGAPASPGKIIGVVRVCKTKEELLKFKEGEILVASMTRPEFVPAMKKASAIVTDEGGLTCHASIVSRELGKPCIVGTKIATKVLKDGDMVEVNANHGTVKKIK